MSDINPTSNYLLYKTVITNKASRRYTTLPDSNDRYIYDYPYFAIHGYFCIDGKEVEIPDDNNPMAVIYASDCKDVGAKDEVVGAKDEDHKVKTGYVSGQHLFNPLSEEFLEEFRRSPPEYIIEKTDPMYEVMREYWHGLSKNKYLEKTWEFQGYKHKYDLPCDMKFYLTVAAHYGKHCMDVFLKALKQHDDYVFGSRRK
ncbi:hypothetical protein AgCh_015089 [Apium graveolens]